MKLTINLVIRKRADLLPETVAKTLPNIARPDTTLMISADDDDEAVIAAIKALPYDARVLPVIAKREDALGDKYNRALTYAPADVYLLTQDDVIHQTPGFDQNIVSAAELFPDGIGAVYGLQGPVYFPVWQAVTHRFAEKMGFIYPPIFPYWFVDHWLDDIAHYIGRIAYAKGEIGRAGDPQPGPTQGRRDVRFWSTLFEALYLRRQQCAREIIEGEDFIEAAWRKRLLLEAFPRTEQRSAMSSYATRREAGASDHIWTAPADDAEEARYQRIKRRAEMMLRDLIPEIEAQAEG